ncbi:MAG: carbohydrate ABC transporter permease [Lachnospiraceae bacterium]|nr:carbohydrate ABC transporter permease [Lachnospiraceae bacterium]
MSKKEAKLQNRKDFWERNQQTNGYLLERKVGDIVWRVVRALLLFGLCFLILLPLINKLSASLKAEEDLFDATVVNLPKNWTLGNYSLAATMYQYGKGVFSSAWISLLISVLQVASATLVGYGFARFNFPLKKFWFGCVVLLIIVPPQLIMAPLHLYFTSFDIFGIFEAINGHRLNLKNSILPYLMIGGTCMGLKNGLYIYLLRQFFRGIPKELEEAAYVDGCGNFKTFIRIMLPDAKAMITSCFLFSFVWQWTDKFYTDLFLPRDMTLISRELTKTESLLRQVTAQIYNIEPSKVQVSVARLNQITATGTLMAIAPLLIIYLFAQKGFVESLSQTGIKM